jgi:hypothetical protein
MTGVAAGDRTETPMPLPRELLDQMAAKRAHESVEADRDRRRDHVRTALQCLGWCALGVYCIGWALHTTDEGLGRIFLFLGLAIGNGGIIFTLLAAYRRGERRGDW